LLDLRAGVDGDGNVVAWESELFIPDGSATFVDLLGADLAGLDSLGKLSPGGVLNDSAIPYHFSNVKTMAHRLGPRRSSRPGSALPGACRTPLPTNPSSMRLRRKPEPIRWSCA
jgi:hypothetical protein